MSVLGFSLPTGGPVKRTAKTKASVGTVAELFAGVGGFRLGLERAGLATVFSNQWEPSTKAQHASDVYVANFGPEGHSNEDISKVERIPSEFDLLVGGFPCQDNSVAKTLNHAKGLRGKKGVLWWEILRLINTHEPKFVFLENVDRLLKSPATQRGRDFAVMLRTLGDAGYVIEWRVVNAAEYGYPQRRIRVFIVATREELFATKATPFEVATQNGVLARALPVSPLHLTTIEIPLDKDPAVISRRFNRKAGAKSPFMNAGFYRDGVAYTIDVEPATKPRKPKVLADVLQPESEVDKAFYIPKSQVKDWRYLKGAKSIERVHKGSGAKYKYAEGSMAFPDLLTNPSRTILTGEGGKTPSRFKHIIKTEKGYRRLTPIELERLNGFPDDWTKFDSRGEQVADARRAFFMGNALVVGLVERVGRIIGDDLKQVRREELKSRDSAA
jgi:DNA (cytosine-5)-methyltransferase 1